MIVAGDRFSGWKPTVATVLSAVLFFVATFIVGAVVAWLARSFTESSIALNVIPLFVGSLLVSAILLRVPPPNQWAALGLDSDFVRPLLVGLALGGGICGLIVVTMQLAGWASWTSIDAAVIRFDWRDSVGIGLLLLAIGAAGEELFVRGYFLQQLGRAMTPTGAIAATSIVFALLHASNPNTTWIATLNTALYGGIFGLAVLWHRSLWISFGIHYAWNCAEALLGANISGLTIRLTELNLESTGAAWLTGGEYGPEAGLTGTAGAFAMAAILWFVPRREVKTALLWEFESDFTMEAVDASDASLADAAGSGGAAAGQSREADGRAESSSS